MEIKPLKLAGTFEIKFKRIGDSRGYFMEIYSQSVFAESGLQTDWVQENQSLSTHSNTIRGLHFQIPPFAQTKLLSVVQGKILDVFVDLRKNSPTYGQWDSIELSEENCKSVYIPRGFAHGFATLTKSVIVQYKIDNRYSREHERGIRWNDADIGIDWNVKEPFLSEKDSVLPFFKDFGSPFKS
ncbi:MAG: dTDP-4-dehydrorhamnose 3,5-epimerase [Pyrinomonadaceae bacterium]